MVPRSKEYPSSQWVAQTESCNRQVGGYKQLARLEVRVAIDTLLQVIERGHGSCGALPKSDPISGMWINKRDFVEAWEPTLVASGDFDLEIRCPIVFQSRVDWLYWWTQWWKDKKKWILSRCNTFEGLHWVLVCAWQAFVYTHVTWPGIASVSRRL